MVVDKGPEEVRVTLDCRELNKVIQPRPYNMPNAEDLSTSLHGFSCFSVMDALSGFFQCTLREGDSDLFVFETPFGTFKFERLVMGLLTSPAHFMSLFNEILAPLRHRNAAAAYVDDCLVKSVTPLVHIDDVDEALTRIEQYLVKLNIKKTQISKSSVHFLGWICDGYSKRIDSLRLSALVNMGKPRSLSELRCFLSACSYHRQFVDNLPELAGSLWALNREGCQVAKRWTDQNTEECERTKRTIITAQQRVHIDPTAELRLQTDASAIALGACLQQRSTSGPFKDTWAPVARISRLLKTSELEFATVESEALSITWAVHQLQKYLAGRHLTVQCDAATLQWMCESKDGRVAQWAANLAMTPFTVEHISGVDNKIADALNRAHIMQAARAMMLPELAAWPTAPISPPTPLHAMAVTRARGSGGRSRVLPVATDSDDDTHADDSSIILPLHTPCPPTPAPSPIKVAPLVPSLLQRIEEAQSLWTADDNIGLERHRFTQQHVHDRDLYTFQNRVCVPRAAVTIREDVMHMAHVVSAHGGQAVTLQLIHGAGLTWRGIHEDVAFHVRTCLYCRLVKAPVSKRAVGHREGKPSTQPGERISVDLLGPMSKSVGANHAYLLVAVDCFTRWTELVPLVTADSQSVIHALRTRIYQAPCPPPAVASTDNASYFTSAMFSGFLKSHGSEHHLCTPYHSPSNGHAERANLVIGRTLRTLDGARAQHWDQSVTMVQWRINAAKTRSTGFSPYEMVTMDQPRTTEVNIMTGITPADDADYATSSQLEEMVVATHARANARIQAVYDTLSAAIRKNKTVPSFQPGKTVLVLFDARADKFESYHRGPYTVVRPHGSSDNIELKHVASGSELTIHAERMLLFDSS